MTIKGLIAKACENNEVHYKNHTTYHIIELVNRIQKTFGFQVSTYITLSREQIEFYEKDLAGTLPYGYNSDTQDVTLFVNEELTNAVMVILTREKQ